ncbi:unnamed protein product, partial [marine sediment metagenome]
MSKKGKDTTTKTVLLVGAGALAAYLLIPRVREAVASAIPEFPSIDLSKLFPEGGGIPLAFPEIDIAGVVSGAVSDTFADLLSSLGIGDGDKDGVKEDEVITTEKSGWQLFKDEVVKVTEFAEEKAVKAAIIGGAVGVSAVAIRYAGPPLARTVGGVTERLASRLFTTKAAVTAAKIPPAGEALGPAAATKLPGQALKYTKPSFWGRLFG